MAARRRLKRDAALPGVTLDRGGLHAERHRHILTGRLPHQTHLTNHPLQRFHGKHGLHGSLWGRGQRPSRVNGSGLIPDEHLDLLARAFVAATEALYWELPADWFGGPEITMPSRARSRGSMPEADADVEPVVMARELQPPLRRWAAARLIRAEPSAWSGGVQEARNLDARSGAAVMAGLVDAADVLPPRARKVLMGLALDWGARSTHLAALEHLARHGGVERARKRARSDSDATIRRWGEHLATPTVLPLTGEGGQQVMSSTAPGPQAATLF